LPDFEIGARWLSDRLPREVAKYLEPVENFGKPALPAEKPAPPSKPSA
jgi:hypothetical protein